MLGVCLPIAFQSIVASAFSTRPDIMIFPGTIYRRLVVALVVLTLGFGPILSALSPEVAFAQDLSVDPKTASPSASDLRTGFQLVPDKSEQREPVPGIIVYEADFVRDQTP